MVIAKSRKEKFLMDVNTGCDNLVGDAGVGGGGSGKYTVPFDFICAGFACCMNINVRRILEKKQIPFDDITIKVEGNITEGKVKYNYHVDIVAPNLSQAEKEACIAEAFDCSTMRKVLTGEVSFTRE